MILVKGCCYLSSSPSILLQQHVYFFDCTRRTLLPWGAICWNVYWIVTWILDSIYPHVYRLHISLHTVIDLNSLFTGFNVRLTLDLYYIILDIRYSDLLHYYIYQLKTFEYTQSHTIVLFATSISELPGTLDLKYKWETLNAVGLRLMKDLPGHTPLVWRDNMSQSMRKRGRQTDRQTDRQAGR